MSTTTTDFHLGYYSFTDMEWRDNTNFQEKKSIHECEGSKNHDEEYDIDENKID